MRDPSRRAAAARRVAAVAAAAHLLLATACVSLTRERATALALRGVCGGPAAVADSTCVVRGAERVRGGYRVTVDRRPPAGRDRVAVRVRRGGSIEVTPVDTAGPVPRD
jgi:hypothetical protein